MPTTKPKTLEVLETVEDVMKALGKPRDVKRLTRAANYQTMHNWKDRKVFPSNLFKVMSEALEERGYTAPSTLWQQVEPAPLPEPHAAAEAVAAG